MFAEVVYSDPRHAIYLGDMPHTWIGAEYARTIFGMLFHEGDERLELLPGAPPKWLKGDGIRVDGLPTSYGRLGLRARQSGGRLELSLDRGLRKDAALRVRWPSRSRPSRVRIDGRERKDFDAGGIAVDRPFHNLVAEWLE
jgi:hypothetical protein